MLLCRIPNALCFLMASITNERTSIRGIIGRKHKAKLSFVRQEAVSSHEIIARSRGVVKGGGEARESGPSKYLEQRK